MPFPVKELPKLLDVVSMTQKQYESFFGGTPMTRPGRQGLRRNAFIAMAVGNDPELPKAIEAIEKDGGFPLEETLAQWKGFSSSKETIMLP